MHDFALAQDIAEQVKAEAQRAGARRVLDVEIEVGGLSHCSAERLRFWLSEALKEGTAGDAAVRVVKTSPFVICSDCRRRTRHSPPSDKEWDAYFLPAQCPYCGSPHVRLEGDSGCTIRHLEMET